MGKREWMGVIDPRLLLLLLSIVFLARLHVEPPSPPPTWNFLAAIADAGPGNLLLQASTRLDVALFIRCCIPWILLPTLVV